eukprot:GHVU01089474.1.p1 GENE.GHVU01089474.1~~GHVU01089474.1.p1  ORF type:complete len:140 (+),score=11.14 GHVU01089474.1:312-731(+)
MCVCVGARVCACACKCACACVCCACVRVWVDTCMCVGVHMCVDVGACACACMRATHVESRKLAEDLGYLVMKGLLTILDFAHVETPNARNLELWMHLCRCLPLRLGQNYIDELVRPGHHRNFLKEGRKERNKKRKKGKK